GTDPARDRDPLRGNGALQGRRCEGQPARHRSRSRRVLQHGGLMRRRADHPAAAWALAALAFVVAAAGARPFAAGYNDGSRLATAESLIERGTLAIDDSPFLGTQAAPDSPSPYPDQPPLLHIHGTLYRVRIDDPYYSDKPPVPAVL